MSPTALPATRGVHWCTFCRREVHRDGNKHIGPDGVLTRQWTHCEDRTPACTEGTVELSPDVTRILGPVCGRDA